MTRSRSPGGSHTGGVQGGGPLGVSVGLGFYPSGGGDGMGWGDPSPSRYRRVGLLRSWVVRDRRRLPDENLHPGCKNPWNGRGILDRTSRSAPGLLREPEAGGFRKGDVDKPTLRRSTRTRVHGPWSRTGVSASRGAGGPRGRVLGPRPRWCTTRVRGVPEAAAGRVGTGARSGTRVSGASVGATTRSPGRPVRLALVSSDPASGRPGLGVGRQRGWATY